MLRRGCENKRKRPKAARNNLRDACAAAAAVHRSTRTNLQQFRSQPTPKETNAPLTQTLIGRTIDHLRASFTHQLARCLSRWHYLAVLQGGGERCCRLSNSRLSRVLDTSLKLQQHCKARLRRYHRTFIISSSSWSASSPHISFDSKSAVAAATGGCGSAMVNDRQKRRSNP